MLLANANLKRVQALVEQVADNDSVDFYGVPLYVASRNGYKAVVRYLVEQGADMEWNNGAGWTPLIVASWKGHLEVVRYLLEKGAKEDKANNDGMTSLHYVARDGYLDIAKLLMVYGADLNARKNNGQLPIDVARTEEIKQAIRDEPQRRRDLPRPRKRCVEQDQHPNAATSASAQQEEEETKNQSAEGEAVEGKVADEDQHSEPSSDEDGN